MATAALAVLTLAAFAAGCSSSDSSDESKSDSNSQSNSGSSTPATQAAATPEGAEAAIAEYVKGENHEYAGDCADTQLPRDKGKWCSTLVEGDDTTDSRTYEVGPVGGKPVARVTVSRKGSAQLTPGLQVGVADGNVGAPQQLTYEQLAGNVFITGNLILDQALGIGNGFADIPGTPPATGGTGGDGGTGGGGTGGGGTGGVPPVVVIDPGAGTGQYPPPPPPVVDNPNVTPGGTVVFRGGGCLPGETLQVIFDGKVVGTLVSDAAGNFAGELKVPVGTAPGLHNLTVRGSACELNMTINVLGGLAFTGTSNDTSTTVLVGVALVVLGTVLVVGARRRRTTRGSRASPIR